MFMSLIDQVPTWIYLTVVFVVAGVVFYFFSPIITAIAAVMPNWMKIALGAVASLVAAFVYGRYRGAKTARELETQKQEKAVQTRSKINESVKNATDAELDKRADRWMRD
jgi:membrane protein implicated in regulation of membrane protease activity